MYPSKANGATSTHAEMGKCRICYRDLLADEDAKDLYDQRNNSLLYHIEAITGVWQISERQGAPRHMCPQCEKTLQKAIEFRGMCIETEFKLTRASKGLTECDFGNTNVETEEIKTELENVLYEGLSESELIEDIGPAGDGPLLNETKVPALHSEQKIQTPRKKHSKMTKEQMNLKRRERLRSKPLSYVCEQCGHAFRMSCHLQIHMLRHSRAKNFECPECLKKFYTSHLRDSHLRVRHHGERPYPCKYCSETFSNCNVRQRHEREIHGAPPRIVMSRSSSSSKNQKAQADNCKRHFCHLCTKSYASKYSLSWHMNSHTGVRNLKCKSCDMMFPDPVSVKRHERYHEQRPLQCDVCLKGFFVLSKLNEHKLIHTGDRPFR
ncbi:zinc finger protein 583-like [Drosophila subobscura]|uniref:zinc finger protein 583-like n=1 Tax=Drosophila subobscura TaxID=7241 RepID=UPI00155A69E5|nr:zinc finger protein 583-like [Drosophila subobscura]